MEERLNQFKLEETKIHSPNEKSSGKYIDTELKTPQSDEIEENIIATHNTSNKKKFEKEEIEYQNDNFLNLIESPDEKPKHTSKVAHLIGDTKENSLRSSLPTSMRETSYFDGKDQVRSLLQQNPNNEESSESNKDK